MSYLECPRCGCYWREIGEHCKDPKCRCHKDGEGPSLVEAKKEREARKNTDLMSERK